MLINVSEYQGVWQWKLYSGDAPRGPCLARSGTFFVDAYDANKCAVRFRAKLELLGVKTALWRAVYDIPTKPCRKTITQKEIEIIRPHSTPYGFSVIETKRRM